MSNLALTLQQIANYCGKETYLKGIEYEDSEALVFRYKDDSMLLAICEGIKAPRYIAKVQYMGSSIQQSSCTCDASKYMPCKHIAALLVTWFYYPKTFIAKEAWNETLESYDKADLIKLLDRMLDIHTFQQSIICLA